MCVSVDEQAGQAGVVQIWWSKGLLTAKHHRTAARATRAAVVGDSDAPTEGPMRNATAKQAISSPKVGPRLQGDSRSAQKDSDTVMALTAEVKICVLCAWGGEGVRGACRCLCVGRKRR